MTRKVYLNVISDVILTVDDDTNINDAMSELELISGEDVIVEDFQIASFMIIDSK